MPELPEVETTRKGIAPFVVGETVLKTIQRHKQLRWPIPANLNKKLCGQTIRKLERRAKYLLFHTEHGCLIIHLGMSGSLRILNKSLPAEKHDHFDLVFNSGYLLRLRDPRRFGCILWTDTNPLDHKLIKYLGPEPLSNGFSADYLYKQSRQRKVAIKNFIMNSKIVVGIGNIYANEALFSAGIHPLKPAGKISRARYKKLVDAIKYVLSEALKKGGTTLRDFVDGNGNPGYFKLELQVYDRANQPCIKCNRKIRLIVTGQRSSFYCTHCQH